MKQTFHGYYERLRSLSVQPSPELQRRTPNAKSSTSLKTLLLLVVIAITPAVSHAEEVTAPNEMWVDSFQGVGHPYGSRDTAALGAALYACYSGKYANTYCDYGGVSADNTVSIKTHDGIIAVGTIKLEKYYCYYYARLYDSWTDYRGVVFSPACVSGETIPPSPTFKVQITPDDKPIIPRGSAVASGKVLTQINLQLNVRNATNAAAPNLSVSVQSNRATDTIKQPTAPTDGSGMASAKVETRNQEGVSTITSATSTIQTATPGKVTWLPARYQDPFLVTCYVISNENDFANTPQISDVSGLPKAAKYRQGFISDVRMQGSGQAVDGTIIHYDGNSRYSLQSCARTATGACATDGATIAVDRNVIPLRGTVNIDTVGSRVARDTGGAITGNHIDVYFGARRAECRAAGRRSLAVDFTNY